MKTYEFTVDINGSVRIDAESLEAAQEEFASTFAHEPVLLPVHQEQLFVVNGMAYAEPIEVDEADADVVPGEVEQ